MPTPVQVYLYDLSQGIQIDIPGTTPHGHLVQVLDMGTTEIPEDVFWEYIETIKPSWPASKYHLFDNNCNSFSREVCMFLVGKPIPEYITDLPAEFLKTPFGRQLAPIIEDIDKIFAKLEEFVKSEGLSVNAEVKNGLCQAIKGRDGKPSGAWTNLPDGWETFIKTLFSIFYTAGAAPKETNDIPKAVRLMSLRLACNLFSTSQGSSTALSYEKEYKPFTQQNTVKDSAADLVPMTFRSILTGLLIEGLLSTDSSVRQCAASLAFNMCAFVSGQNGAKEEDTAFEEWGCEVVAALLKGIEEESNDETDCAEDSIENYELRDVIGQGGFGVVYNAISKRTGNEVAIKLIDKQLMKQANMSARVANEVEIHWQLRHPSILELLTYFEDNSNVYLVMELCPNGELFRFMQKRGVPLTEPEARRVLEQLIWGLMYLHNHGIIHRDLKLSNLLLTRDFDVKIGDFGLAVKLMDPNGEQKTMCGTPNYISPEIVSRQPYGLSSDVWSLGCLMVTMLTGKPPFDSSAVKNTLVKVSRVEFQLPEYLSPDAKELIHSILQKDPKSRPSLSDILQHSWFQGKERTRLKLTFNSRQNVLDPPPPISNKSGKDVGSIISNGHSGAIDKPAASSEVTDMNIATAAEPIEQTQRGEAKDNTSQSSTFTTARLKPIRQKTRHGVISISESGQVAVDFVTETHVITIDSTGTKVQLHNRLPTGECAKDPSLSLDSKNLPTNVLKIYKYAAKFVDLVKSKTPKIIFYSPQAKCMIMENGPHPDFEVAFYNGVKCHHSSSKDLLEFKMPRKSSETDTTHYETHRFTLSPYAIFDDDKENAISVKRVDYPMLHGNIKEAGKHDCDGYEVP
ncbi:hypothetical protein HDV05_001118 [Chytridiales sp. JEL 0842]|nr:hypothetical protein HDV05_001118 [Chytridiales sp. JEL 0842]